MSFTAWVLILGIVGAGGFFGRRLWLKRQEQAKKDQVKKKHRAEQAELDRIACLDLGKSLMSSAPGGGEAAQEKAGAAGSKRPG